MLWLDAFCANVDRSWRNPNLLLWHGDLWVIDHGAALYFHHGWPGGVGDPARFAAQPWHAADHVLGYPDALPAADAEMGALLDERVFAEVLAAGARRVAGAGAGRGDAGRRALGVRRLPTARLATRQWLPAGVPA